MRPRRPHYVHSCSSQSRRYSCCIGPGGTRHAGKTRRPSRSGLSLCQRWRRPSGRARPKSQAGGKRRALQQCPTHRHTRCPTGCHGKSQLCPPWQCWSTQHHRPMRRASHRPAPLGREEVRVAEGAEHTRGATGARCRNCNRSSRTPRSRSTSRHTTTGIRQRGGAAAVAAAVGRAVGGRRGAARPREPRTTASASGKAPWPWSPGASQTRPVGYGTRQAVQPRGEAGGVLPCMLMML